MQSSAARLAFGGWLTRGQSVRRRATSHPFAHAAHEGMDGKEAHMWIGDIAPGAATGTHRHSTPRFVYVMEGSVVLEMEGKPAQTFKAGQGFMESPDAPHNFKNSSTSETAKALGFQIAGKGQPLQY